MSSRRRMSEQVQYSDITAPEPKPSKTKKERSPAQIQATAKALSALHAKRKEAWETKKVELVKAKTVVPVPDVVAIKEEKPVMIVEKQEKPVKQISDMPEWAKTLESKIDAVVKNKPKKKIKYVVDESSSDEEEIVIRRKKEKVQTIPAPVVAPVVEPPVKESPDMQLRRMLYRR